MWKRHAQIANHLHLHTVAVTLHTNNRICFVFLQFMDVIIYVDNCASNCASVFSLLFANIRRQNFSPTLEITQIPNIIRSTQNAYEKCVPRRFSGLVIFGRFHFYLLHAYTLHPNTIHSNLCVVVAHAHFGSHEDNFIAFLFRVFFSSSIRLILLSFHTHCDICNSNGAETHIQKTAFAHKIQYLLV